MKKPAAAIGVAIAAIALGFGLTGCSKTSEAPKTSTSSSASSSASASSSSSRTSAATTSAQASGANETIGDYLKQNNIEETVVRHGDAGSPTIDLPVPGGWTELPENDDQPYGGISYDASASASDPATVQAKLAKLTGNVTQDGLFAVAHGSIKNLPGFTGSEPEASTLANFPATQIGGSYTRFDQQRAVYEKTVLIEGANGTFVLQLIAESADAERGALQEAMQAIDEQTTITP